MRNRVFAWYAFIVFMGCGLIGFALGFPRWFEQWVWFPVWPNIGDATLIGFGGVLILYLGLGLRRVRGLRQPAEVPAEEQEGVGEVKDFTVLELAGFHGKPGWRGRLPIYLVSCRVHGLLWAYPHGWEEEVSCPICDAVTATRCLAEQGLKVITHEELEIPPPKIHTLKFTAKSEVK